MDWISFIWGILAGCVMTFFAIMGFAKYMPGDQKEMYKELGKERFKKSVPL